ncbi:DUF3196 family protein [Ureaplasma urealyticum]|nr:DUF3196 family protein [Ureaplasma urealyticum]EDX53787.1 conserved hypothetical protein [Ureaplasma urealyticum serovar 9 str. ATCC 33175]ACI59838.1 conserved hypothetical protein [Ureaplasma urealyticum serovar 10 str. ATCC 33699]EDT49317.1 conserved hypothetical protein [Ureaplasma urealyticum serovar 13 str. ATCC 33698]EDU06265.1 conserved hypothetical protein [Ureaplasma urealyticum serovar 5 str. ATCC 27817]EDU57067.1 conserved hypothetical protein [Ureaplasma urealyticum serovar 7 st
MNNDYKGHIKKYFDDILKQAKQVLQKRDYGYAYDLISNEFNNPLIDLKTLQEFEDFALEIKKSAELDFIDENEAKLAKTEFYHKIHDPKTTYVSLAYLETFLMRFINEIDQLDIAFLNNLLSNKTINGSTKLDILDLLAVNNIDQNFDFYNKYLKQSKSINPTNPSEHHLMVVQIQNYLNNDLAKNPSLLNLANKLLMMYITYHFPFAFTHDPNIIAKTIIDYTKSAMSDFECEYNQQQKDIVACINKILEEEQE